MPLAKLIPIVSNTHNFLPCNDRITAHTIQLTFYTYNSLINIFDGVFVDLLELNLSTHVLKYFLKIK